MKARFYASHTANGKDGEGTKMMPHGGEAYIRSWESGIKVSAIAREDGTNEFEIEVTTGSNGSRYGKRFATLRFNDKSGELEFVQINQEFAVMSAELAEP